MVYQNKCLIVGSEGHIGKALCWAMAKLDYNVVSADCILNDDIPNKKYYIDATSKQSVQQIINHCEPNLVISALPYFCNVDLADSLIQNRIPYFDLGGNVDVSETINERALKHGSLVLTDLGLAPGWVNIIAENMVCFEHNIPDCIDMCVGGIPQSPEAGGILKYCANWSMDGLLNEYTDNCQILVDGVIDTVPGMSGLKHYTINGGLEAFYTSGGISHTLEYMKTLGVKNCCYRTLRWPGHHKLIQWLLSSEVGTNVVKHLIQNTNMCANQVIIYVYAIRLDGNMSYYDIYHNVVLDDIGGFTSMQKCTAFPCAAAVHTIMLDKIVGGYNKPLTYSNINYKEFNNVLRLLDRSLIL